MRHWLIYATYFVLTSALGIVFVFLEDVQTANGLADWEIGVIAGTGFGAALLVQLLLSPLADRGTTGPVVFVALATGIIGPLGFAYGTNVVVLAASRGLSGIGLGLFGLLARKALLGLDATGGGAKLGVLLSTAVAGFILGPIIGAAFEPFGFAAPFWAVSVSLIVLGIPAAMTIAGSEIAASPVDYSDLGRLLARPKIQAAMIVQAIVFGIIGVFDAVVDRFLTDLGATTTQVAITVMCVGGPLLILPRIAGNLAERRGAVNVMLPGLLAIIPTQIAYGLAGTFVVVAVFGLLHGVGESFATISAQVLVLEVTGAERAAVGSALLEAAGLTTATVTAILAPTVYGSLGGRWLFFGSATIAVALAVVAFARVAQGSDRPLVPA